MKRRMLLAFLTLHLVVLPAGGGGVGVVGSVCVRDASDAAAREEEIFPRASWQAVGDPGIRRAQKRDDLAARAARADSGWCTGISTFYNGSRFPNPRESQQLLGVSDSLIGDSMACLKSPCWILKMQVMDILVTQHESVQLRTESGSPNIPMKLFL